MCFESKGIGPENKILGITSRSGGIYVNEKVPYFIDFGAIMNMSFFIKIFLALSVAAAVACSIAKNSPKFANLKELSPAPTPSNGSAAPKGPQKAVFAGGCFWGVDAVFKHVKGVTEVKSGYSGGK